MRRKIPMGQSFWDVAANIAMVVSRHGNATENMLNTCVQLDLVWLGLWDGFDNRRKRAPPAPVVRANRPPSASSRP